MRCTKRCRPGGNTSMKRPRRKRRTRSWSATSIVVIRYMSVLSLAGNRSRVARGKRVAGPLHSGEAGRSVHGSGPAVVARRAWLGANPYFARCRPRARRRRARNRDGSATRALRCCLPDAAYRSETVLLAGLQEDPAFLVDRRGDSNPRARAPLPGVMEQESNLRQTDGLGRSDQLSYPRGWNAPRTHGHTEARFAERPHQTGVRNRNRW